MPIALRAWFGQDEVSHGSERYRVGRDRLVIVPQTVAVCLIKNAGFEAVSGREAKSAPAAALGREPQSLVRVRHPSAAGCSYDGREYRGNDEAEFQVPTTAVADLMGHGFVPIEPAERSRETPPPILISPASTPQSELGRGPSALYSDEPRGSRQ